MPDHLTPDAVIDDIEANPRVYAIGGLMQSRSEAREECAELLQSLARQLRACRVALRLALSLSAFPPTAEAMIEARSQLPEAQ